MKRILIIEDDVAIAEIERDYLEVNSYSVEIASDGMRGIDLAQAESYDLILLDLMLPGLDGFTVCRKLREKFKIPILIVTAKRDDLDKIKGLCIGADDYITKPFSPSELVARVKANIAQFERIKGNDQELSKELTVGNICIKTKSHRVYIKNKEVELKNKEYELLLFLVTNSDMVFSKESLYEKIWGYDALGDSATVPVHINRLREKIEEDSSNPQYIQTVWGVGYRFVD